MADSRDKAKEGLRFAINFLRSSAGIEDESLLSSLLLVIPLAVLGVNSKFQFSEEGERQQDCARRYAANTCSDSASVACTAR